MGFQWFKRVFRRIWRAISEVDTATSLLDSLFKGSGIGAWLFGLVTAGWAYTEGAPVWLLFLTFVVALAAALYIIDVFRAYRRLEPAHQSEGASDTERDVHLTDAVAFIATGTWPKGDYWEHIGGSLDDCLTAIRSIRQAAADGKVTIWGKNWRGGMQQPIKKEYWIDHELHFESFMKSAEEFHSKIGTPGAKSRTGNYMELMASKSEVERFAGTSKS